MIFYYISEHHATHLPDLADSEDLFNVLALCNFCILSNVLDPRTYSFPDHLPHDDPMQLRRRIQYDYNALSPSDRKQFTFFRGLARNLIAWIDSRYMGVELSGPKPEEIDVASMASNSFRRQVAAFVYYKVRAIQHGAQGSPGCTLGAIQRQLQLLLEQPILGMDATDLNSEDLGTFTEFFVSPSDYRVGSRNDPEEFHGKCFLNADIVL